MEAYKKKTFSITLIFIFHVISLVETTTNGFLGCGGFVKSDFDINYSLVEIKLYTIHGSLKYKTDCAPNNGYYLIPLYDKGHYILKIEPPDGWAFEPSSFELHVDGSTDLCSKGEDINFRFIGFSIYGQVLSVGQSVGPSGVVVTLNNSTEIITSTITDDVGRYTFSRVKPGKWDIRAKHPIWKFRKDSVEITMEQDNIKVSDHILIQGYPVSGQVYSDKEPIKGVIFILFSKSKSVDGLSGCDFSVIPGFDQFDQMTQLCHTISSDEGSFKFPVLPTGKYTIIPFYKGEFITFDVKPPRLNIDVKHQSLAITEIFEVAGFSVSGRVLLSTKGVGIAGAKVALNGVEQSTTDIKGVYQLMNLRTGHYMIDVTAPKVQFNKTTLKITPNSPDLPDIIVARYEVCGKVYISKPIDGLQSSSMRKMSIECGGRVETARISTYGVFCTYLQPGLYTLSVIIDDVESKAGLYIIPTKQEVKVVDSPLKDIVFNQFLTRVSGSVKCLEKCGVQEISLESVGRKGSKTTAKFADAGNATGFTFNDILPGKYKVVLVNDLWCWKDKSLDIEVSDRELTGLTFVHTGYIFKCLVSHEIALNFTYEKTSGSIDSFKLSKGLNRFCLAESGVYHLTPVSCHQFDQTSYTFDTSNPVTLTLTALKHKITGRIHSTLNVSDVLVNISTTSGDVVKEVVPSKHLVQSNKFEYHFSHWARAQENIVITPLSKTLLFYPPSSTVTVKGDVCPGEVVVFDSKIGLFIRGSIQPAIEGVHISITSTSGPLVDIHLETDPTGKYSVGPLAPDQVYEVSADKPGYILSKVPDQLGVFSAFKLAEIIVKVIDGDGLPLSNVLLSLSGGSNYRSNNLTSDTGVLTFLSISPGKYFLRAMMKEYTFEPSSQIIEVTEGSTSELKITGNRVAFSCFGRVTSLNGEPESGVLVEAVGVGLCSQQQEECVTDQDGNYRIRGLEPSCMYNVQLNSINSQNEHIKRSVPAVIPVQVSHDVHDVRFITFRRVKQLDISGNVITSPEFLPTLKVRLFKEDNPDVAIHTVSLATSTFFYFPSLPIDNQIISVVLETSLTNQMYEYTLPDIKFPANSSHRHFTISFTPQKRKLDADFSHSSIFLLPLTAIVVLCIYYHELVRTMIDPYVSQALAWTSGSLRSIKQQQFGFISRSSDPDISGDLGGSKKRSKFRKT